MTWPKVALSIFPSTACGPKNCAWLNALNASEPELERFRFGQTQILQQRQVEVVHSRSVEKSPLGRAGRSQSVLAELQVSK